jgi:sec-independent protein translocase protein TatB
MFDIGFWELLVLAALGLLILGPERLPRVIGQLGRWLRQARRTASQLRWQIEHELDLTERREAERKRRDEAPKAPVDADATRAAGAESVPKSKARVDELHGGGGPGDDLAAAPAPEAPPSPPAAPRGGDEPVEMERAGDEPPPRP